MIYPNYSISSALEKELKRKEKEENIKKLILENIISKKEDWEKVLSQVEGNIWLVDKFIPRNAVILLAGKAGALKTSLAFYIYRCVVKGENFLGKFACQRFNVLYITKDESLNILYEKIKRLGIDEDFFILDTSNPEIFRVAFFREDFLKAIKDFCLENGVKLVIFDTFVRFMPPRLDENKAEDVSRCFQLLRSILCSSGISVLVIQHLRKIDEEIRGSTDFLNAPDVVFLLQREKNGKLVLSQLKNRLIMELEPLVLRVNDEPLSFELEGSRQELQKLTALQIIIEYLNDVGATDEDIVKKWIKNDEKENLRKITHSSIRQILKSEMEISTDTAQKLINSIETDGEIGHIGSKPKFYFIKSEPSLNDLDIPY